MSRRGRWSAVVVAGLAGCSIGGLAATAAGKKAPAARHDAGVVYLSIVHQQGKLLDAAGFGHSKIFGSVAITYVVGLGAGKSGTIEVHAKKVTLYTSNGSLSGTGSALQTVTATKSYVRNGKVSLTRGTGGQQGHTYKATFSGPFNAKTGVYTFHFQGTYR